MFVQFGKLMFCLIRHAGYHSGTGSLTPKGSQEAELLAAKLQEANPNWRQVRTSPAARTRETALIIGKALSIPVETDERISADGNAVDLLPPTEPKDIIFVSHLPVITKMLRSWSTRFKQDEPPLTNIASGYLVDPDHEEIRLIAAG